MKIAIALTPKISFISKKPKGFTKIRSSKKLEMIFLSKRSTGLVGEDFRLDYEVIKS